MSALARLRAARQQQQPPADDAPPTATDPLTAAEQPAAAVSDDSDEQPEADQPQKVVKKKKKRSKEPKLRPVYAEPPTRSSHSAAIPQATADTDVSHQKLDSLLQELNGGNNSTDDTSAYSSVSSSLAPALHDYLATTSTSLDPSTEIKQRYGVTIRAAGAGNGRVNASRTRGGVNRRMLVSQSLQWRAPKRTVIVRPGVDETVAGGDDEGEDGENQQRRRMQAQQYWPPYIAMGLSTSRITQPTIAAPKLRHTYPHLLLSPTDKLFTFTYDSTYDRLQQEFLSSQATSDPSAISFFVRHYPYHPEANLQMSFLLESQADYSVASVLVKRAIFSLEQAITGDISLLSGDWRLDHRSLPNKALFSALYKQAQLLGKKGCSRTALECSKLLLSLSPLIDPTGILLSIDYYAIRGGQYQWLLDFSTKLDASIHYNHIQSPWNALSTDATITQSVIDPSAVADLGTVRAPMQYLPNILYNRALAKYHLEQTKRDKPTELPSNTQDTLYMPTFPLTAEENNKYTADELLQIALVLAPEVLPELLQTTNNESLLEREPWQSAITHLKTPMQTTYSPHLDKLTRVFAARSNAIWRGNAIIQWLQQGVERVVKLYSDNLIDVHGAQRIRRLAFSSATPTSYAGLEKHDYTDETPRLPPEVMQAAARNQELQRMQQMVEQLGIGEGEDGAMLDLPREQLEQLQAMLQDLHQHAGERRQQPAGAAAAPHEHAAADVHEIEAPEPDNAQPAAPGRGIGGFFRALVPRWFGGAADGEQQEEHPDIAMPQHDYLSDSDADDISGDDEQH